MMAIVGSRMLAGVAFLVVVALAGYSYFPDFGHRQGKRRSEPVTTTASIGEEVKKDQTALEETPALPSRGLRTRGQPAAEAPADTEAAVETAALPQRTQTLPGIATTDPGTSMTSATNLLSPFPAYNARVIRRRWWSRAAPRRCCPPPSRRRRLPIASLRPRRRRSSSRWSSRIRIGRRRSMRSPTCGSAFRTCWPGARPRRNPSRSPTRASGTDWSCCRPARGRMPLEYAIAWSRQDTTDAG